MSNLKEWQIKTENGIFDKRNQVNNLTGKEWLFSTRSVKTKVYNFQFNTLKVMEKNYIDFMPIELIIELIMTFTKANDLIINPGSNFGSIAKAIATIQDKRQYLGFNYNKIDNLFNFDNLDSNSIVLTEDNLNENSNFEKYISKFHLFSELIFTSLNNDLKYTQYKNFEKMVVNSIKVILKKKMALNYIILCVQNSRDFNRYYYYSKLLTEALSIINCNLKAELIWKIPETNFLERKSYLIKQGNTKETCNLLLNDKRILIFKLD